METILRVLGSAGLLTTTGDAAVVAEGLALEVEEEEVWGL